MTSRHFRIHAVLLAALGLAASASAVEGPTRPDSIVFNHTIPLADEPAVTLPLYFTRRGFYFGEVLFERAAGAPVQPVEIRYSIDVLRRGELLFTRTFHHTVNPGQRAATLFRVDTDREVPLKTKLDFVVRFGELAPQARDLVEALTFQIYRNPGPAVRGRF